MKKNNKIIFFGPSGTGKTTFCKILQEKGYKYIDPNTRQFFQKGKGDFISQINQEIQDKIFLNLKEIYQKIDTLKEDICTSRCLLDALIYTKAFNLKVPYWVTKHIVKLDSKYNLIYCPPTPNMVMPSEDEIRGDDDFFRKKTEILYESHLEAFGLNYFNLASSEERFLPIHEVFERRKERLNSFINSL